MCAMNRLSASCLPRLSGSGRIRTTGAEVVRVMRQWSERRRGRIALAWLEDHLLRDVGLDAQAAAAEVAKPFWR